MATSGYAYRAENARINLPNGEAAKQAAVHSKVRQRTDDCEGDESDYHHVFAISL